MSYPDGSSWPVTEWLINGSWVDLSERVREAGEKTEITRGRQNEQGTISPTQITYTMNNHDRAISNRRPASPYYRLIPPGTQIRTRAGDGDNAAYLRYNNYPYADDKTTIRTADKASLDITGDMEIRIEVTPHTWRPTSRFMMLAGKYSTTADQRSWILYLDHAGRLYLSWSTAGTHASRVIANTGTVLPAGSARLAIKVTLDVNNGAAGSTTTFYTAPSINGTYTQLGTPVVIAGVTSIFASTAELVIGGGSSPTGPITDSTGFGGKVHAFHLYNGIAGTRVANPDFSAWAIGSTSLADSHSNTWATSGQARISSPRVRFWGELTSATQLSDRSTTDLVVPIQGADITQRLGSGRIEPNSPLFLNISPRAGLLGYWPLEDRAGSEFAASAIKGGRAASFKNVTFGQDADLPGAKTEAELSSQASSIKMYTKRGSNTGMWNAVFLFKVPNPLPVTSSNFVQFVTNGNARNVSLLIGSASWTLRFDDTYITPIDTVTVGFGTGVVVADEWIAMRVKLTQSGGTVNWEWAWYQQGSGTFQGTSGSYAGTVGYPTAVTASAAATGAYSGSKLAHFVISEQDLGFSTNDLTWSQAIEAYAGESAVDRIKRIAESAGIYCEFTGRWDSSAFMGAQPVDTPLNVMLDAARTDGGFLVGLRDAYGLSYRMRQDLEAHADALLDYGDHLSEVPEVIDDDQSVVNAVTASRTGGSSAYAEITEGPNSTATPPLGVGFRPGGVDVNVYKDAVLQDVANLRARISSFDQARIPNLSVALNRKDTLPTTVAGAAVMGLDLGDTANVAGWPAYLPPDEIGFLVQGYRETLSHFLWDLRFNTTPAGPYRTGRYGTGDQATGVTRWGSSSSTLTTAISTTDTTLVVAGLARVFTVEVWSTVSARYPLNVMIEGEEIRLNSAPTGDTSPQTFNGVTRSINGIVKTHGIGAKMQLVKPTYYGLKG